MELISTWCLELNMHISIKNQGSLFIFSKLEVTSNVILFCFCHFCENPKDISFVRFDRFFKHTARIRLGNFCEPSFLMFCLWNSIKTDQKNTYLFLLKLSERTKKIWIRECFLLFWVTASPKWCHWLENGNIVLIRKNSS